MALKIKIDPVEKFSAISVRNDLTLPEQKRELAAFVSDEIADADQANQRILGRIPPKTVTVDGRLGAPLDSVNPDGGNIVVEYELISDVLRWIGKTLVDRSPEVSGAYKRGHTLFVDGNEVALNGQIPQGEEYAFTNMVPYSRKIEIGTTKSGRSFTLQVPNHIYQRTANDAKARFGNIADIFFTYRGIVGGFQINPLKAGATAVLRDKRGRFIARGGVREHNKSELRYPTIYLRYRKS